MDPDHFLDTVKRWIDKEQLSDLKIAERLKELGVKKGRESIRKWIRKRQKEGRLPVRVGGNRAGRKRKAPKVNVELLPPEVPPSIRGLGVFEAIVSWHPPSRIFELVAPFLFEPEVSDLGYWEAFAKAKIPQGADSEIDLVALAQEMGRDQVFLLTDIEFFLLALIQPILRVNGSRGTTRWITWVAREALEIKNTMHTAVAL